MTDKELLEFAAKAAGMDLRYYDFAGYAGMIDDDPDSGLWNPLTDDGDSMRLAVSLGMWISIPLASKRTDVITFSNSLVNVIEEAHEGEPLAATRRAIVRAAAEIGKAMK